MTAPVPMELNNILLALVGTLVSTLIFVVKNTTARSDRLIAQRDEMLGETIKLLRRSVESSERSVAELVTHLELIHNTQERILEKVSA